MDADSEAKLKVLFKPHEAEELIDFLYCFSFAGKLALVSAFLELQEYDPFDFIMEGCKLEWPLTWERQDPDSRGDPNVEGIAGAQSRMALETLYNRSGILSSLEGAKLAVPSGAFSAVTRCEIFVFGEANDKGWREVTRLEDSLSFKRCVIGTFEGEKPMQLWYQLISNTYEWYSAVMVSYDKDPRFGGKAGSEP